MVLSWTCTTEKLYELLQWAHSEGLADLATMNSYLETMADQTELFKSVKADLENQKQVKKIFQFSKNRVCSGKMFSSFW